MIENIQFQVLGGARVSLRDGRSLHLDSKRIFLVQGMCSLIPEPGVSVDDLLDGESNDIPLCKHPELVTIARAYRHWMDHNAQPAEPTLAWALEAGEWSQKKANDELTWAEEHYPQEMANWN